MRCLQCCNVAVMTATMNTLLLLVQIDDLSFTIDEEEQAKVNHLTWHI
jgi:hypothetical protein